MITLRAEYKVLIKGWVTTGSEFYSAGFWWKQPVSQVEADTMPFTRCTTGKDLLFMLGLRGISG